MNKLFDEKLAHIKKCQVDGLEEIRKGSPSNLADIADHLDLWGPWMLSELALAHRKLEVMSDALEFYAIRDRCFGPEISPAKQALAEYAKD